MIEQIIGYVAGTLTTIAFLPQVIKAWRSKSTKDISLWMFLLFTIGVGLWLIYGIVMLDFPILSANLITLALAIAILLMKIKFR